MNFDFSEDQRFIQSQAREFLQEQCPPEQVRLVLESDRTHHQALWRQAAELGWTATAIPEAYGGLGLGHLELCLLAKEDRKSTRLNSSHVASSYAVFCLKKKTEWRFSALRPTTRWT